MPKKPASPTFRLGFSIAIGSFFLAQSGCSQPAPETGELSGHVTLRGEPVLSGSITLFSDDGRFEEAAIQEGSYILSRAPVGVDRVVIRGRLTPPPSDLYARATKGRGKPTDKAPDKAHEQEVEEPDVVPGKYASEKTTDLTYEVKPGPQRHNFDLEPQAKK